MSHSRAIGGANCEDASGWEFSDVGKAFALLKPMLKSIQDLYNRVLDLYQSGHEAPADVADMLGIPNRTFLVPQLLVGFDKLIASKKLSRTSPEKQGKKTKNGSTSKLGAVMVGNTGVKDTEQATPAKATHNSPQPEKRTKSWGQIQSQAGVGNKKSAACTIL